MPALLVQPFEAIEKKIKGKFEFELELVVAAVPNDRPFIVVREFHGEAAGQEYSGEASA